MKIIPAIDIIGGQCVRLSKGDYNQKTIYEGDPADVAQNFAECGVTQLHLVDLDGAKEKRLINLETIESICNAVSIPVEVGGGIRSGKDIEKLFSVGVSQVILGSLAVTNPEIVAQFVSKYGSEKIVVGIDVLNGIPRISGWTEAGEVSLEELMQKMINIGIERIIITDVDRDGMLESPNFELYRNLGLQFPQFTIVASGGVSSIADLRELEGIGVKGAIIGKSLYEGNITLNELSQFSNGSLC